MSGRASDGLVPLVLLFLFAVPGALFADQRLPTDYLTNKPLLLEVRYCQCPATDRGSGPSDLLPRFLDESTVLKVGIPAEDAGFLNVSDFSMGYKLRPVNDSPDRFQFEYAASYETSDGNSAGQGNLLLVEGQWVHLFGSHHKNESGAQHTGVAVRLIETVGS